MAPRRLVLAVIDGMAPAALSAALEQGRAPVLQAIKDRGLHVEQGAAAAFPSVTPVCATAIATGVRQDRHHIPAMNWFWRAQDRYVEYGSSFGASRRFGIARQLNDTIYNLNGAHIPAETPTVFERLDDVGARTVGTTFLVTRGRHEHRPARDTPASRLASTVIRKPLMGPTELFYADIFASRETGCRGRLGMPGNRDEHSGCVGAYVVEHDLVDFLLLSLPDNDRHSHDHGPRAQVTSIQEADRQLGRLAAAAGGVDAFLDQFAVVAMADHGHDHIEHRAELVGPIREAFAVLEPGLRNRAEAELAYCPSQRSAQLYGLAEDPAERRGVVGRAIDVALGVDGIELAVFRDADGDGVVRRAGGGELTFAPGTSVEDERGGRWRVHGDLEVLGATIEGEAFRAPDYPAALARMWAALECPTSGDVLLSCAPGWEVPDWGDDDHVGGGSHGSLHRVDSLGALLMCGLDDLTDRELWSITDLADLVVGHVAGTPAA